MYTNSDITVYNKAIVDRETVYLRSTVKGVFWSDSEGSNRLKMGVESSDKTRIFVPFSAVFSKRFEVDRKKFLKDTNACMTLSVGDLVVQGLMDDEIKTQKELESKYDHVREITSVDVKNYGSANMQHVELMCK